MHFQIGKPGDPLTVAQQLASNAPKDPGAADRDCNQRSRRLLEQQNGKEKAPIDPWSKPHLGWVKFVEPCSKLDRKLNNLLLSL